MEKLTHYVNGEQIEGTSGRYADVYNPATGEVQYQCPLASKSEVEAIIVPLSKLRSIRALEQFLPNQICRVGNICRVEVTKIPTQGR